ncbi:hypothetical protein QQ045_032282 [Rhodiola kirilowii]
MTIVPADHNQKKKPRVSSKSKRRFVENEKAPLLPKLSDEGGGEFNGASFIGAVFNLSTTIIGAGIMALPAAMKVLGVGVGVGLVVVVGVLSEASIEMLLRFSKAGKKVSYGGVMEDAFGGFGKMLLQICVLVNNVGILIVYMIIIGDVLSGTTLSGIRHAGVLEEWFGEHWWSGRIVVLLVATLAVFAPMASFKRIDSLRFTSALAVALALVFLAITAGITAVKLASGTLTMPRWLPDITNLASVWNLSTVVPVLVTAYICHYNVHTIENELEQPSLIQPVVQTSLSLCSIVYIMISFFGLLLFGDSTLSDVLSNFDSDLGIPYSSLLNDAVRVSYVLHLMLVFPIIFHPLRLNLDGLLFPSSPRPLVSDNRRFTLLSIALIFLILLGANLIPNIWVAFQFTGSTAAVCLGFIFPACIALKDPNGVATNKDKVLSMSMIGLAVFTNGIAIYSNAYALYKQHASPSA